MSSELIKTRDKMKPKYCESTYYRYSITNAGCELADKLEMVEAQFGQHPGDTSCPIGGAPQVNKPVPPAGQSRKRTGTAKYVNKF